MLTAIFVERGDIDGVEALADAEQKNADTGMSSGKREASIFASWPQPIRWH